MPLKLSSGKSKFPSRICVYGVGGIGKTTLATLAPAPAFIDADDGSGALDVQRVNYGTESAPIYVPPTLADFYATLDALLTEKHDRKTLVVDTLDAIEALVQKHVCDKEKMTPGEYNDYGRGTKFAIKEWRQIIAKLSELRNKRSMHILLLGHYVISDFKNPAGLDYQRFTGKLEKAPWKLFYDWCDVVAFAQFEDLAGKNPNDGRVRGVSTDRRYMSTKHCAAWDAKSRGEVDEEIEMNKDAWKKLNGEE